MFSQSSSTQTPPPPQSPTPIGFTPAYKPTEDTLRAPTSVRTSKKSRNANNSVDISLIPSSSQSVYPPKRHSHKIDIHKDTSLDSNYATSFIPVNRKHRRDLKRLQRSTAQLIESFKAEDEQARSQLLEPPSPPVEPLIPLDIHADPAPIHQSPVSTSSIPEQHPEEDDEPLPPEDFELSPDDPIVLASIPDSPSLPPTPTPSNTFKKVINVGQLFAKRITSPATYSSVYRYVPIPTFSNPMKKLSIDSLFGFVRSKRPEPSPEPQAPSPVITTSNSDELDDPIPWFDTVSDDYIFPILSDQLLPFDIISTLYVSSSTKVEGVFPVGFDKESIVHDTDIRRSTYYTNPTELIDDLSATYYSITSLEEAQARLSKSSEYYDMHAFGLDYTIADPIPLEDLPYLNKKPKLLTSVSNSITSVLNQTMDTVPPLFAVTPEEEEKIHAILNFSPPSQDGFYPRRKNEGYLLSLIHI